MALPTFDEMLKMSPKELDDLLNTEAEKVIQSAEEERQPRLRAIFNGCVLKSQAAKSPHLRMVLAFDNMWSSFERLDNEWQNLRGLIDD